MACDVMQGYDAQHDVTWSSHITLKFCLDLFCFEFEVKIVKGIENKYVNVSSEKSMSRVSHLKKSI